MAEFEPTPDPDIPYVDRNDANWAEDSLNQSLQEQRQLQRPTDEQQVEDEAAAEENATVIQDGLDDDQSWEQDACDAIEAISNGLDVASPADDLGTFLNTLAAAQGDSENPMLKAVSQGLQVGESSINPGDSQCHDWRSDLAFLLGELKYLLGCS